MLFISAREPVTENHERIIVTNGTITIICIVLAMILFYGPGFPPAYDEHK